MVYIVPLMVTHGYCFGVSRLLFFYAACFDIVCYLYRNDLLASKFSSLFPDLSFCRVQSRPTGKAPKQSQPDSSGNRCLEVYSKGNGV